MLHCKHKSVTPFWVAAGYVQAWQRAHDITLQHIHWFAHVLVDDGTFIHHFNSVIRGYHVYIDGWDTPIAVAIGGWGAIAPPLF